LKKVVPGRTQEGGAKNRMHRILCIRLKRGGYLPH
jgi:hypothetical protein